MGAIQHTMISGYTCTIKRCRNTISGAPMHWAYGTAHYQKLGRLCGWSFWFAANSVKSYCWSHHPGPGHSMIPLD